MKIIYTLLQTSLLLLTISACGTNNKSAGKTEEKTAKVIAPKFNADSAYQYVKAQVDFGPRVPNTSAHVACGNYLANKLTEFGATVTNQYAELISYDKKILKCRNIIGSYKPESKKRILLFSHWDSRPWADNDPNEKNHHTPILGADDGASGVGTLLEIARLINKKQPELGIDIIFFDAEDYGAPEFYQGEHKEEYWCLGTQYWAKNPHVQNYNARFGILLDMVGGKNATFYKEGYSLKYAKSVVKKVWKKAHELGYEKYFINEEGGFVTDDHYFVNKIARIPSIDIIPSDRKSESGGFAPYWHTLKDNMDIINKTTLKVVGQTILEVIYNEK
ncbi:M28 family peptidase [uncultured Bacteroides sp.]|uniref:M20 family metallopeptidase n=1 Tax=uncultured Bacteroides sp. TaxID=162156 RepID=UPI002AABE7CA|nr:M28 family peptidase [uncultured Bacteroides sp.]